METMGDRLRAARLAAGYPSAAKAAAAIGAQLSTYRAHENSQNGYRSDAAKLYAKAFGVSIEWLLTGELPMHREDSPQIVPNDAQLRGAAPETRDRKSGILIAAPNATVLDGERVQFDGRIPVFGSAIAGENGEFILNGNKIADMLAPRSLLHVSDAYAVLVAGDSMEPRFFAGEVVFVDPRQPARKGQYVIAQITSDDEGGAPLAYVKRFVRLTADNLILDQINPVKELTFPRSRVVSVHLIVGSMVNMFT